MAVVVRAKWKNKGRRTLEDRASVIAFNVWKIAQATFKHMEKEGFRFGSDAMATGVIAELIAFLVQVVDRIVYGQLSEEDRGKLINAVALNLAKTMEENQLELLGPGEYKQLFISRLNERFREYAECPYSEKGPSYAVLRLLGEKVSDTMAAGDNKWVVEHVMEIESPEMLRPLKKVVGEVLGVKTG